MVDEVGLDLQVKNAEAEAAPEARLCGAEIAANVGVPE